MISKQTPAGRRKDIAGARHAEDDAQREERADECWGRIFSIGACVCGE